MKICGCGFANQDDAQACLACGAPFDADVAANAPGAPIPLNAPTDQAKSCESELCANRLPRVYLILENVVQSAGDPIVIPVPGGIIGRAGDFSPGVFSPRVSGIHAALDFSRGRWSIKHLGRNKSYLLRASEWIELPREQAVELLPGDRLRLADMLFAVSISPYDPRETSAFDAKDAACASDMADVANTCGQAVTGNACNGVTDTNCKQNAANTEQTAEPTEECWIIACPVCGARYEVDSFDARVNECATCLDALDKRRIASVTPKHEVSASDPVPGLTYHKPLSDRFDSEWV